MPSAAMGCGTYGRHETHVLNQRGKGGPVMWWVTRLPQNCTRPNPEMISEPPNHAARRQIKTEPFGNRPVFFISPQTPVPWDSIMWYVEQWAVWIMAITGPPAKLAMPSNWSHHLNFFLEVVEPFFGIFWSKKLRHTIYTTTKHLFDLEALIFTNWADEKWLSRVGDVRLRHHKTNNNHQCGRILQREYIGRRGCN